jgi:hypothetical protein
MKPLGFKGLIYGVLLSAYKLNDSWHSNKFVQFTGLVAWICYR